MDWIYFKGKWNFCIICVLANKKTLRYTLLRKEMVNITYADIKAFDFKWYY